jgi:hypothetical protein
MNWTSIFTTQAFHRLTRKGRLSLASLSLAVLSGVQIFIPSSPANAFPLNIFPPNAFPSFELLEEEDYAICAQGLQSAGLSPQLTAQACAMAVRPTQISTCVTRINSETGVSAEEALLGCVSVRRPEQMATCVVDITLNRSDANPLSVLDSCSRSLLPVNHAYCVLGLTQSAEALPVANALDTCLTPPEQFIDLDL